MTVRLLLGVSVCPDAVQQAHERGHTAVVRR